MKLDFWVENVVVYRRFVTCSSENSGECFIGYKGGWTPLHTYIHTYIHRLLNLPTMTLSFQSYSTMPL